jgi:CheY-like chemotaxis protein
MKTILQVEDDSNDVLFLQRAMKKVGVANPIQVATDGRQAIDYLKGVGKFADRELFPLPGLVLLDLKLPYVMGLDVLKWIRQQSGMALVVVLLTASAEDADIATAYRLGANGFLVKPSKTSQLEDMLRALNDFWLMQNTPPSDFVAAQGLENLANPRTAIAGNGSRPVTSSLTQTSSKTSRIGL